MSKEALSKIRSAETAADNIRANARAKAQDMISQAGRRGAELCRTTESSTSRELLSMLSQIRKRSEDLIEKSRAEAQKEARAMEITAKLHMNMAVKLIVWGIVEKCQ